MGVANSKRVYSGGPNYSTKKGKEDEEGADGKGEEGKGDEAPAEEAPPPSADELKMKEVKKWKSFFKDIIKLPEAKDEIKTKAMEDKAAKSELASKGIVADMDNVKKFANAEKDFLPDVILFFDPGLMTSDKQPVKFDAAVAEPSSEGTDDKKTLKKDVKFDEVKPIFDLLLDATKIAKKHAVFRKIIKEYVADSDRLKDAMKAENITGAKDAITSGEEGATKNALGDIKGKEKGAEGAETPPAAEGGADNSSLSGASLSGASLSGASLSGASLSGASMSGGEASVDTASLSGASLSSGSSYQGSTGSSSFASGSEEEDEDEDDELSGGRVGKIWRNDEEKLEDKRKNDYKKFKKQARGDFKKKMKQFFEDGEAMAKFMDENEPSLLQMAYYGKIPGKWIDKSKESEKQAVAEALVKAVNEYTPKEDKPKEEGAPKAEGDAAAGEKGDAAGEKGDAAGEKADGAGEGEDGAGEGAKGDAKEAEGGSSEIGPNEEIAGQAGGKQAGGKQAGGAKKEKKKRYTRKKHKHINININVGDKNVIENSSSSSSSDSSSSSSSDSSSDSSSESDDSAEKKQKYTVKKKKNSSKA